MDWLRQIGGLMPGIFYRTPVEQAELMRRMEEERDKIEKESLEAYEDFLRDRKKIEDKIRRERLNLKGQAIRNLLEKKKLTPEKYIDGRGRYLMDEVKKVISDYEIEKEIDIILEERKGKALKTAEEKFRSEIDKLKYQEKLLLKLYEVVFPETDLINPSRPLPPDLTQGFIVRDNISQRDVKKLIFDQGLELEGATGEEEGKRYFIINGLRFDFEMSLGSGSFGSVGKYTHKNEFSVAIKDFTQRVKEDSISDTKSIDSGSEYEINVIRRFGDSCNLINSRIMNTNGKNYIVMEFMDGNAKSLIGKLSSREILEFIDFLGKSITCLQRDGYCYTDIKTENILYKIEDRKIRYYLGDLGSAVPCLQKERISGIPFTYPPLERYPSGFRVDYDGVGDVIYKDMNYGIGIAALVMTGRIDSVSDQIYGGDIRKVNRDHIKGRIENVISDLKRKYEREDDPNGIAVAFLIEDLIFG